MQDPLKQGLKRLYQESLILAVEIRMQDPLKQGLKHIFCRYAGKLLQIRMQDPLKQGLKHYWDGDLDHFGDGFECKIH